MKIVRNVLACLVVICMVSTLVLVSNMHRHAQASPSLELALHRDVDSTRKRKSPARTREADADGSFGSDTEETTPISYYGGVNPGSDPHGIARAVIGPDDMRRGKIFSPAVGQYEDDVTAALSAAIPFQDFFIKSVENVKSDTQSSAYNAQSAESELKTESISLGFDLSIGSFAMAAHLKSKRERFLSINKQKETIYIERDVKRTRYHATRAESPSDDRGTGVLSPIFAAELDKINACSVFEDDEQGHVDADCYKAAFRILRKFGTHVATGFDLGIAVVFSSFVDIDRSNTEMFRSSLDDISTAMSFMSVFSLDLNVQVTNLRQSANSAAATVKKSAVTVWGGDTSKAPIGNTTSEDIRQYLRDYPDHITLISKSYVSLRDFVVSNAPAFFRAAENLGAAQRHADGLRANDIGFHPKTCGELADYGVTETGIYRLTPKAPDDYSYSIDAYCDNGWMKTTAFHLHDLPRRIDQQRHNLPNFLAASDQYVIGLPESAIYRAATAVVADFGHDVKFCAKNVGAAFDGFPLPGQSRCMILRGRTLPDLFGRDVNFCMDFKQHWRGDICVPWTDYDLTFEDAETGEPNLVTEDFWMGLEHTRAGRISPCVTNRRFFYQSEVARNGCGAMIHMTIWIK